MPKLEKATNERGYYLVDCFNVRRAFIRKDFYKGLWWGDTCNPSGGFIVTRQGAAWQRKTRREVVEAICEHLDLPTIERN